MRLVGTLTIVGLLAFPAAAQAQQGGKDCAALAKAATDRERDIAKLLKGYAGTRSTLEFCATGGTAGADATKAFLQCAGISCFVLGLDTCETGGRQVLTLVLAGLRAKDDRTRLGCP